MQEHKRVGLLKKLILAVALLMSFVLVGSVQSTSYAASNRSKNKKALAAYEKLLSKSTYKWSGMSSENKTKNFIILSFIAFPTLFLYVDLSCRPAPFFCRKSFNIS